MSIAYADMDTSALVRAFNEAVEIALSLGLQHYKPVTRFPDKAIALDHLKQIDSSIKAARGAESAEKKPDRKREPEATKPVVPVKQSKAELREAGEAAVEEFQKDKRDKGVKRKKKNIQTSLANAEEPATLSSTKKTKHQTGAPPQGQQDTPAPPDPLPQTEEEDTMANRKSSKKSTAKARKGVAKATKTKTVTTRATDEDKIVGVGANPFREGTSRYEQLEKAKKAGTVGKFVKADGDRAYLSWYQRNGHVKVG